MTLIEVKQTTGRALRGDQRAASSDRELTLAAIGGDSSSFDVLFSRHRSTIERAAAQVLRDGAEAQDAVQQTFVKTWLAVDRLDPDKPFGPWARTVARRVAIDLLRGRDRRERVSRLGVDYQVSAEIACAELTQQQAVREAVAMLPEVEQQVVALTYFGGLTHHEAADWLDIPVGTVKSRSNRAHRRLAHLLRGV
ncbi:MAG: putative polymerase subfamily sigma factor [Acidimicrobiales bacterium]|nr:putative polymerase subfamily sigma factor [Acidimicrobiales bacterium]